MTNFDEAAGKAKQVEGDLTGDEARKAEGEAQEAEGKLEQAWDKVKDTAEDLELARAGLRARIGYEDDYSGDDPAVDSYTGDPLPGA